MSHRPNIHNQASHRTRAYWQLLVIMFRYSIVAARRWLCWVELARQCMSGVVGAWCGVDNK